MAKCHRNPNTNNVGSLLLDRHPKLWSAFSTAAFRRKLLDTITCGVSRHRPDSDSDSDSDLPEPHHPPPSSSCKKNATAGSEKLSEILKNSEVCAEEAELEAEEMRRKVEVFEEFQAVVKRLQVEHGEKKMEAALDVRRLAKEDGDARETLAMLGAIPTLVGMLDEERVEFQIASLYAILNLGIGNDANKAAIVTAGAVHKMLNLIDSPSSSVAEAIVANFLALSALDSNKPIIGTSGAIPFLVKILQNADKKTSCQAKQDSLRAIYNLSILPSNIMEILETDLVPFMVNTIGDMEVSERILSILCNVVSTPEGRKSVSNADDAFSVLVDVLNWNDSPRCQEKASYILMVMAHKAYGDRQAMIEAGIVSSLLELTLLGSTLAQKRASRILECFSNDKGKQVSENYKGGLVGAVSAPIYGSSSSSSALNPVSKQGLEEEEEDMMSAERKAVKQLVQQSLQNNMRRIVKRANLPQDFVPSEHFKTLTTTSSSKSVPF